MKRLAILSIVLLALATLAFAELKVEPTVALSGSATLTWGVDLETFDTGFANSADADLTVTFIAADTAETKAGEGAAYGSITISDIEMVVGGDVEQEAWDFSGWVTGADVSAKIVVAPIEIGVYSAPTMYTDCVAQVESDDYDDNIVDIEGASYSAGGGAASTQPFGADTWGTYVKATVGPIAATVKLVSDGYDETTDLNNYAAGAEGVLTAGPAVISFGGYADWVNSGYGFYGKADITAGPVVAWAGFMGNYIGTFSWLAGAGATLTMANTDTAAVLVNYGDAANGLDLRVNFTEPAAGGFVDNLDFAVTFYLLDVANTVNLDIEYEAVLAGGYKIVMNDTQYIRPYADFTYGDGNDDATFQPYMYADAGVQLQLIPLTLFMVAYASGDLAQDANEGADLGTFTVAACVTY